MNEAQDKDSSPSSPVCRILITGFVGMANPGLDLALAALSGVFPKEKYQIAVCSFEPGFTSGIVPLARVVPYSPEAFLEVLAWSNFVIFLPDNVLRERIIPPGPDFQSPLDFILGQVYSALYTMKPILFAGCRLGPIIEKGTQQKIDTILSYGENFFSPKAARDNKEAKFFDPLWLAAKVPPKEQKTGAEAGVVGISIFPHNEILFGQSKKDLDLFRLIAKEADRLSELGYRIVFLVSHANLEERGVEFIRDSMDHPSLQLEYQALLGNAPAALEGEIAGMSFVIAMRRDILALAARAEVPFLPLLPKDCADDLLLSLSYPLEAYNPENLSGHALKIAIDALVSREDELKNLLADSVNKLHNQTQEDLPRFLSYIEEDENTPSPTPILRHSATNPVLVTTLNSMGLWMVRQGEIATALGLFSQTIEIDATFLAGYSNLGVCHLRLGERDRAEELFNKALLLNPDFEPARENLKQLKKISG